MKPEDIEAFCKSIRDIEDIKLIHQQLDKISNEDLLDLTNRFLQNPFQFKQATVYALHRLFEDTPEFADILNNFFVKTCSDYACVTLYEPLKEKLSRMQNQVFSLLKRMMHLGKVQGIPSGILLSWIIQDMIEAEEFMVEGLSSKDSDVQRCSLVALQSVLCRSDIQEKGKYFETLKRIASSISQDNIYHLINCLQCCFEELPDEFEPILEKEIINRGSEAAKDYIRFVHYKPKISFSILQKAVEMLESMDPDSQIIDTGLAKIYEYDPDFFVEILRIRLQDYKRARLTDGYLLQRINEVGSEPVLRMIDSEIDNGNPILLNIGEGILENFFPHFEDNTDWVMWCEKWKDDARKEKIILKSLGLILTKLINHEPNGVRDRAIVLVRDIAIKKGIDYAAETDGLNFGKDSHTGKENKENTIKALYVLERILSPPVPIDLKTLSENLKKAPHLSKAMDAKWLIKSAGSCNPHPIAYLFHRKLPDEKRIERLREELEKEKDENRRLAIGLKYEGLIGQIRYQSYWENVFKILEQHGLEISKSKLHDVDNAWSILVEAEVFSRLAPYFIIEIEPDIPELRPKRLEALIEYDGEKALIEVRAVQERLEISLAHGGISVPGGKVKSVLLNKFKGQLNEGKSNPRIPILIILNLDGFMDSFEVENSVYGQIQFSWKMRNDTHETVEEGTTRKENAFYDEPGTEIVTAIVAYKRDYGRKDPLVGKMYYPYKPPTNKMSQKFKIRLRDALFGISVTSDWKSLMRVYGIDEKLARLLFANGIEDLGILASIRENEFVIEDIHWEELSQLQKEAIRVIGAISTGSIRFLKGIDKQTFTILESHGIYIITKLLEQGVSPDGISSEVWSTLKDDAKRISARFS